MKRNGSILTAALGGAAMLILILDAKLVLLGAVEGIELCLWTVVPSLFPFFVVSSLINGSIAGKNVRCLRFLGRLFKIPQGSESILLLGFVGGYPVGAQNVKQAYDAGIIKKQDASRMLAFCNNAGPAFIFGMVSQLFESPAVPWLLWLITILSALFVALSFPGMNTPANKTLRAASITLPQAITNTVKAMANVCAWVMVFRIAMTILQYRLLVRFPLILQNVVFGFLELSNGIIQTTAVSDPGLRFVLCAVFLNAGGFCVAMQTQSVSKGLGMRTYITGKTMQTIYSALISLVLVPIIFRQTGLIPAFIAACVCIALLFCAQLFKKRVAFSKKVLYNIEKL